MPRKIGMVSEEVHEGKKIYVCDECGFGYLDKRLAIQCEIYCKKMGICSTDITRQAVRKPIV